MRQIRNRLLWLLVVFILLAAAGVFYAITPLGYKTVPVSFTLKAGSSLKSAAQQMRDSGVLQNDFLFVFLARVLDKADKIKPGEYRLEALVSPIELLEILSKGRVVQAELTIIEGWTFKQFRCALDNHPKLRHDSTTLSDQEILQRLGVSESKPEGLFFPDTYQVASGSSDFEILKQAYGLMQQHLQQDWESRPQNSVLKTPYEALILASIVEKETGQAVDRAMIASVFHNRLRKGMLLQTDPTVIYGMGERFDGNIRKRDLLNDTAYNTYTRVGLPPTPIALPGRASIQAALHPAESEALYFVGRGNGTTHFSATLEEHNRMVRQYQK